MLQSTRHMLHTVLVSVLFFNYVFEGVCVAAYLFVFPAVFFLS